MAWLNALDAPKEKEPQPLGGGDKKGRGAALWRSDSFDDEPAPVSTSRAGGTPRSAWQYLEGDHDAVWQCRSTF